MPRKKRGRRGAGVIREVTVRGRTRYQARWSWTEGGVRHRKAKSFELRNDAEWWISQSKRHGTPPEDQTLAQFMATWLAGKRRVRASTRTMYEAHVWHITQVLGGYRLTDLRRRHVEAFVEDRLRYVRKRSPDPAKPGRVISPSTVGKLLGTLRSALEEAVPLEIPDNPAAKVEAPEVRRVPVAAMTPADARAIVAAVRGTWLEHITRFLLGSGLRAGEALSLDQRDIHDGWVSVRTSKTHVRAVRISADANLAIREAKRQAPRIGPEEPVFWGVKQVRGKGHRDRMRVDSMSRNLAEALEAAGLPRLTAHKLRHGTATLMVAAGVPMRVVAEQLGHANPSLTARTYAHVSPESAQAAMDVLDEAMR